MLAAYGGRCSCCGETETAFLTLEHLNGDGAAHRREVHDAVADLRRRGWPKGEHTVLCMNCNWARRVGRCPHEMARVVAS
jgi:hypothetical protein